MFHDPDYKLIVVYQCKNLGDSLLTTPLITALLERFPRARLLVVCKVASVPIFDALSGRVSVASRPSSLLEWGNLIKIIIKFPQRCVWLPHASTAGLALAKITRSKSVSSTPIKHWLLGSVDVTCPVRLSPWRHTAEVFLDSLRQIGFQIQEKHRKINISSLVCGDCESVANMPTSRYVVVHPGSRWMFKSPNHEFWHQICKELRTLGHSVVVTGGTDVVENELCNSLGKLPFVKNVAGKTDLYQLAHLIDQAIGFIGIDTFSMHLAAGLGVPGVILFGPTSEVIWGPYGSNNRLQVITSGHTCRPCHTDGCGGGKVSDCLTTIDPRDVVNNFASILNGAG